MGFDNTRHIATSAVMQRIKCIVMFSLLVLCMLKIVCHDSVVLSRFISRTICMAYQDSFIVLGDALRCFEFYARKIPCGCTFADDKVCRFIPLLFFQLRCSFYMLTMIFTNFKPSEHILIVLWFRKNRFPFRLSRTYAVFLALLSWINNELFSPLVNAS